MAATRQDFTESLFSGRDESGGKADVIADVRTAIDCLQEAEAINKLLLASVASHASTAETSEWMGKGPEVVCAIHQILSPATFSS